MKLWTYWNKEETRPPYIDLCLDTFKNAGLECILVTDIIVHDYLSDLRKDIWKITSAKGNSPICHRVDYIRALLLYKYGGVWLDADTIVMREFDFWQLLDKYDFIGTIDLREYVRVDFMACKQNSLIMKKYCDALDKILDESLVIKSASEFGSRILTKIIEESNDKIFLIKTELTSPIDWKRKDLFFKSKTPIRSLMADPYFVNLYNRMFPESFVKSSKEDIMNRNILISKLFRKALND